MLHAQERVEGPCAIVCDKGFAGVGTESVQVDLGLVLERHNAHTTEGLRARVRQRILALKAGIRLHWRIGAPVKRSLVACDH
ncbi:hypothetical protein HNR10_003881 [Nocardiopsis aegyptia]|uniref:Transposase n=1 Tax=Nocardiopsis aegyptia TaxID=220378 RepID=A0A7Z0JBZ9_9ACTN|nr:hypothetical protein [Nocardiopsis aegyptia]NYJ36000.1 hypothetical protein [Nocardiopsis aegyptia]